MTFSIPLLAAVLAVGLAAILGYLIGHRAGSRATRELAQSEYDLQKDKPFARHFYQDGDELDDSLVDAISAEFAMMIRYKVGFSLAIFKIDNLEQMEPDKSSRALRQFDRSLAAVIRETDTMVRLGRNQFLVLMRQTDIIGTCEFADRFRQEIQDAGSVTISGGITLALDGDSPDLMVLRAHEALASSVESGGNCVSRHDGIAVEPILESVPEGSPDDVIARC